MTNIGALEKFKEIRARMLKGGGDDRLQAQHDKGKLTARERIDLLVDEDSFIEHPSYMTGRSTDFGMDRKKFLGDGVVTGSAKVGEKQIFLTSQDFSVLGGSLGEMHAKRISEVQSSALKNGVPFVQINDSGGARIQEGILSLNGYGEIFRNNTLASGVIPQLSVILGPCAGGAAYSPGITDFVFMVDGVSNMYITGPDVLKTVTNEIISHDELGGAGPHTEKSGVAHFRFETETECLDFIRKLLSYLPSNNMENPPISDNFEEADKELNNLINILPDDERKAYDIRDLISEVFDRDSFLEVHREYARNIVVGFAKLQGRTVGLFANQPNYYAAALDIDSSDKAARFIRFCDSFNIPVISLVDVPGFLPGVNQEHRGIIRHGAKILYAIAEATVPKISLILRKAYGGAYIAMCSKALGYDRVLAWPTSRIAVMGAEGAANIIFRKEINDDEDPVEKRKQKISEFEETMMNPFVAAGYGYVDDIIDPKNTRMELIRSLEMNLRKKEDRPVKKHGNIPL